MLGGNHDHALVAGLIEERLQQEAPLELQHDLEPDAAGPLPRDARRGGRTRAAAASPTPASGCATTSTRCTATTSTCTRRCRRSSASPPARWRAGSPPPPGDPATPDDYEAVLVAAVRLDARARAAQRRRDAQGRAVDRARVADAGRATSAPSTRCGRRRSPRASAPASARSTASASGRSVPELSGPALRQGSLHGIGEVLRRLRVDAAHVVFGHSHRSGPWPDDDGSEWVAPTGARLTNTGSWVYQRHFLGPTPVRLALLARHRRRRGGRRPAAARATARRPRPRRAQGRALA